VRVGTDLEESQAALGQIVSALLGAGAVPVVLGGGHETAFGHYLGYVGAERSVGILNLDAHLDVRPLTREGGHSGSCFRQALEHPNRPLPGTCYTCLGAQPQSVSRVHVLYLQQQGGVVRWADEVRGSLREQFSREVQRLSDKGRSVYVTLDADVVGMDEVPGVSAPNPAGLSGLEVLACAMLAGSSPKVRSLDLVEINPRFDPDGRSARWAALVLWNFLVGLASRTVSFTPT
jgi:formiminoglutamase